MEKLFNLSLYKELLKLEKNGDIAFLDLELLSYKTSVAEQIYYKQKKDYFILVDEYLSGIIMPYKFWSKFIKIENENSEKSTVILKDFKKLEVFTLAQDLKKFSDLICQISTLCLDYNELRDGTIKRMTENEFYSLVNNHYLQLQKFFPFENFK